MKKIILGVFIGVILSSCMYFGFNTVRYYLFQNEIEIQITKHSEEILLHTLQNIKIHGIGVQPSKEYVNYSHDKLYKVTITYEKNNKIKRIAFNIGMIKRKLIVPSELELLELDKNALILFDKSRVEK